MARVVWSREARRNLDKIGDRLLDESPDSVAPILNGLYEAAQPLTTFPRMGRAVPGFLSDDLRELIHEQYRIVYEIEGRTVTIIAVFHAAMDVETRLHDLLGDT